MSDLTAEYFDDRQNGNIVAVSLAAVKVFKGALLTFNSAGYADVGDASEPFAGVAIETVDNSNGNAGDKTVRVYRDGVVTLPKSSAVQADVGKDAFITDDNTVHVTGAAGLIPIGQIVGLVDSSNVRVQLQPKATAIVVDTTT